MEKNDYSSLNVRNNGYTTLNCFLTARGLGKDVYLVGCNIVGKARMEHVPTSSMVLVGNTFITTGWSVVCMNMLRQVVHWTLTVWGRLSLSI